MKKLQRRIMKWIWRESFYIYLWSTDWLEKNKPKVTISIDSRDYREINTYVDRTSR